MRYRHNFYGLSIRINTVVNLIGKPAQRKTPISICHFLAEPGMTLDQVQHTIQFGNEPGGQTPLPIAIELHGPGDIVSRSEAN